MMVKVMPDKIVKSIDKDLDWWKYVELKKEDEDKVLVVDTDIGLDIALGIGISGYKTYYAQQHASSFPMLKDEIVGYGFNQIRKIWDWGEGLENGANVIVFTDSGFGALADWLRSKGYYVFGADAVSEKLELDRRYVRRVLNKLGVKIPSAKELKGIKAVVDYIDKTDGKKFVKISRFRGDVETFGTDDPKEADFILRSSELAMLEDEIWFVIEDNLEGKIEIGVDAYFNGKDFTPYVFETIEKKNAGNVSKAVEYDNSIWYDVLEKLRPYLERNGYRGMFALEGFFDGKDIYVTDVTPRFSFPCSYGYTRHIENFAEFIIGIAKGEEVEQKIGKRYSVQIQIYNIEYESYTKIFDESEYEFTKYALRKAFKSMGKIWFVPGSPLLLTSVAYENKLKDAFSKVIEYADEIKGNDWYHRGRFVRDYVKKIIERANDLGYDY